MSSTSIFNSSYEYSSLLDDTYERVITPALPPSLCTALTHPLVYYTEIQPKSCGRSPGKERKQKRNCFARAFKWYSQEHKSLKRKESLEPCGFASWLDTKYSEYMQESEADPLHQQPSINEQVCPPCRKARRKRFCGLKRPWGKRSGQNLTEVEAQKTQQGSCQFVLQPKDLTRPPSECCHAFSIPIPAQKTTSPTEIQSARMTFVKSHSVTSINYEHAGKCLHSSTEDNINKINEHKGVKQTMSIANTPCDPCCHSETFIRVQLQKALEKLEIAEPLCNPNCTVIPPYESEEKKQHGSAKINMKDKDNKENCQHHEVALEKVSTKTLTVVSSPSTGHPDCENLNKTSSHGVKSEEIANCCDATCYKKHLKYEAKVKSKNKAQEKKHRRSEDGISSGTTDLETQRKPDKTTLDKQKSPVSGSGTNISKKKSEAKTGVVCSKTRKIFCSNSSCTLISKLKSEKSSHVGLKRRKEMELPCGSDCPYFSELKNLQKIRCIPSLERKPAPSTQEEVSCECKTYEEKQEEQLNTPETQNVSAPCDPSCCTHSSKQPTNLETKTTAEALKREAPCVTTDKTQFKAVRETGNADKSQLIETSCDPNCTYLSKEQTIDIPRDSSCGAVSEFKTLCDPVCMYNSLAIQKQPSKNESHEIQKSSAKMEYVDSCNPCYELNQENKNGMQIPLSAQQPCSGQNNMTNQHAKLMDETEATTKPFISCECNIVKPTTSNLMKIKQTPVVNPKIDHSCDVCFGEGRKMSVQKVPSIQKTNHTCKYPEYQTLSIKVDDQFESHLHTLDPANTTGNKYILIPENRVIPFKPQSQCGSSCQHVLPTNIPFQLIVFEKMVLPEQINSCQYPEKLSPEIANRSSIMQQTTTREVSCQYSMQDVNEGSISQYEQTKFSYCYDPACLCDKAQAEKFRMVINEQQTNSYTINNVLSTRKLSRSLSTHRSGGMQTSDHSIRLDDDSGPNYAFFMKIVCADKLNDCNCDKST